MLSFLGGSSCPLLFRRGVRDQTEVQAGVKSHQAPSAMVLPACFFVRAPRSCALIRQNAAQPVSCRRAGISFRRRAEASFYQIFSFPRRLV